MFHLTTIIATRSQHCAGKEPKHGKMWSITNGPSSIGLAFDLKADLFTHDLSELCNVADDDTRLGSLAAGVMLHDTLTGSSPVIALELCTVTSLPLMRLN